MLIKGLTSNIFKKYLCNLSETNKNPVFRMSKINYFGDAFLDRCAEKRKDKKWIDEHLNSNDTKFILFHIDKPFVRYEQDPKIFSLYKLAQEQVKPFLAKDCITLFLGLEYEKNSKNHTNSNENTDEVLKSPYCDKDLYDRQNSKAWFAIDTFRFDENAENIEKLFENGSFLEGNFMRITSVKDKSEASIISQARSMFCWHDRNQFCSTCGSKVLIEEAGFKHTCSKASCKSNNKSLNVYAPSNICYPRIDPVVIMLVVNREKTHFLLGRKRSFPKKMFSCLAGFVEAGESVEEAVRREIHEECGIYSSEIVFHSTQPWPFPSNLMIGCLAYATSDDIKIETDEIEEARWFSIEEIGQILNRSHPENITVPPSSAIANRLIQYWFQHKSKL